MDDNRLSKNNNEQETTEAALQRIAKECEDWRRRYEQSQKNYKEYADKTSTEKQQLRDEIQFWRTKYCDALFQPHVAYKAN